MCWSENGNSKVIWKSYMQNMLSEFGEAVEQEEKLR